MAAPGINLTYGTYLISLGRPPIKHAVDYLLLFLINDKRETFAKAAWVTQINEFA